MDLAVDLGAWDAPLLQPVPQTFAGDPGEWAVFAGRFQARCLADQEHLRQRCVGLGIASDRDRLALVQESGLMAAPAGAQLRVVGQEKVVR